MKTYCQIKNNLIGWYQVKKKNKIMVKFEVGQRLFGQGEYECVIVKRTAKTVTIKFAVSGRMVLKKISNSPRSEYEYVSLLDYDLRAIDVDQPMQTPHNQLLFFNGVCLDPSVEF